MWLLAVAILYLPSRWFMELRSRHRVWTWLSYLLGHLVVRRTTWHQDGSAQQG